MVDDSAVARQGLTQILSRIPDCQVAVAPDPLIATDRIKRSRPDVIVLDLDMPRMDGLTFLRKQMAEPRPIPVVVCSSLAAPGTEAALSALEEGAVSVVAKPRGALHDSADLLIETVQAAAKARVRPRRVRRAPGAAPARLRVPPPPSAGDQVVVIGASTGGTEALREILETLPPETPPIVVVQHMPEVFTAAFAQRLDQSCALSVKEAEDGDVLSAGMVLVAPGDRHTRLRRGPSGYQAEVVDGPPVSRHRPSVDVLFTSAAVGPNALGILLTGMGRDGAQGLLEMRRSGAHTIVQDEATCVVFGMPREAMAAGAAAEVLPLARIAEAITRHAATCRTAGGLAAQGPVD